MTTLSKYYVVPTEKTVEIQKKTLRDEQARLEAVRNERAHMQHRLFGNTPKQQKCHQPHVAVVNQPRKGR